TSHIDLEDRSDVSRGAPRSDHMLGCLLPNRRHWNDLDSIAWSVCLSCWRWCLRWRRRLRLLLYLLLSRLRCTLSARSRLLALHETENIILSDTTAEACAFNVADVHIIFARYLAHQRRGSLFA